MKYFRLFGGLVAVLIVSAVVVSADTPVQSTGGLDYDIPGGHFFGQTRGAAPAGYGFAVVDDSLGNFWAGWRRLGGIETLGYPISHRYRWNGAISQAFQKGVLSATSAGLVVRANLLDELSRAGKDQALANDQFVPPPFDWRGDMLRSFAESQQAHEAILRINPSTQAFYAGSLSPLDRWGLPMSAADYAEVYVVRTQKAVIQQWRVKTPWSSPSQILIANIGEIARDYGMLPASAAVPVSPGLSVPLMDWLTGPSDSSSGIGPAPSLQIQPVQPFPLPLVTATNQPAPAQLLPVATAPPTVPPAQSGGSDGPIPFYPPTASAVARPFVPGLPQPTFFPTVPGGNTAVPSATQIPLEKTITALAASPTTGAAPALTSTPTRTNTPVPGAPTSITIPTGTSTATNTPTATVTGSSGTATPTKTATPYGGARVVARP